jgi:hypothetical protein
MIGNSIVSAQTSTLIGAETGIKSIAAVHSQCLRWVKTRIYRTATLTPASPQSADMPRQAQALPYSSNLCWGLVLAGMLIPIAFAESEPA